MKLMSEKMQSIINIKVLRLSKKTTIMTSILLTVFLFSLCLVLLYPLLIMVSISFRKATELFDPTVIWIPKSFTLDAFAFVLKELEYFKVILLTGRISIISSLFSVLSCSFAGYAFAKFNFKLKNVLFILLIFTIIVPPQIVALPTTVYFRNFDFFGLGLIPGIITGMPFTVNMLNNEVLYYLLAGFGGGLKSGLCVFIFIQFFKGLPKELQDAAYIDGCGKVKTFIKIILPNSKPPLLTVFIFSIVWYWNDFYTNALFFDDLGTVSRVLKDINALLSAGTQTANIYERIPQIQASALLFMLPMLVMYLFLQKYFTESIERSGIVG